MQYGAWPRTCIWLTRVALKHRLDASRRAQILTLTRSADACLGQRGTKIWYALSRAAHHAYELAPPGAELRTWHSEVLDLTRDLDQRRAA